MAKVEFSRSSYWKELIERKHNGILTCFSWDPLDATCHRFLRYEIFVTKISYLVLR